MNLANKYHRELLFLLVTTIAVYWNGLSGILMLDDGPQLLPIIQNITPQNWTTEFFHYLWSNSGQLSRPVSMASFIANAALFADNIWYWKLTNVIFHSLCGLSIFVFTLALFSLHKSFNHQQTLLLSIAITFFWLVHPLHISTVLYVVQRMTILSTFFIFLALSSFLHGINKQFQNTSGKYYFICAIFLFFPLAVLSKESGVIFPVFALLLHYYLKSNLADYITHVQPSIKPYIKLLWIILFIGFLGFIYLFDSIIIEGYQFRQFSLPERLLTQPRVILLYISQILMPLPSLMGFYHDDIKVSTGLLSPYTTILSIITLAGIISLQIIKAKKLGLFSFGLLFFFCSHLLESSLLPLEIAFEHRNYIGSWGVITAVVISIFRRIPKPTYSLITVGLLLTILCFYRASLWGDANIMYPHMMAVHPKSLRLKIIFADTYANAGQYDKALNYLQPEKGLGVDLQRLYLNCKENQHIPKTAILNTLNDKNSKISTYEMEGIISLANLGLDKECHFDNHEFLQFLNSIMLLPIINNVAEQKLLLYMAHYYYLLGQTQNALNTLELSYVKDNSNPIPLFLKIDWLIEAKRYKEAKLVYITAKKIADNSRYGYAEFISNASAAFAQHNEIKK